MRTLENLAADDVVLSEEELAEIDAILEKYPVVGSRYVDGAEKRYALWG